jgi:hypothetical protein
MKPGREGSLKFLFQIPVVPDARNNISPPMVLQIDSKVNLLAGTKALLGSDGFESYE